MTNLERWRLYTRDLPSPDSYINFSFYYMIAASLQRRVWVGPEHSPIFPNMYVILVGEPGLGKSIIIKQVYELLSFYKKPRPDWKKPANPGPIDSSTTDKKGLEDSIIVSNYLIASGEGENADANNPNAGKKKLNEDPLLIPICADTTTFEALIKALARSYDAIAYEREPGKWKSYTHSSLCAVLEEMSSIFSRKDDRVPKLMLKTYDCGDYVKETASQGNDIVRRTCMNFLAGTTPSFMQETFNDRILNDGWSSRCHFVFEYSNRKNEMFFKDLDTEQLLARQELRLHVYKLTKLFGQYTYSKDAELFLIDWYKRFFEVPKPNPSIKLKHYYSRKKISLQKMALAIHASEDAVSKVIGLESCIKALTILDAAERNMHFALSFGERNPLAVGGKEVMAYIRNANKPVDWVELMFEMNDNINREELGEIMSYLLAVGKVECKMGAKEKVYTIKKEDEKV